MRLARLCSLSFAALAALALASGCGQAFSVAPGAGGAGSGGAASSTSGNGAAPSGHASSTTATSGSAAVTSTTSTSSGGACPGTETECSGACVDLQTSAANCGSCGHACAAHEVCTKGSCGCPLLCKGVCVGDSDPANCGQCNQACVQGEACDTGTCKCEGSTICPAQSNPSYPASCTTPDSGDDPTNCGACGNVCKDTQICEAGTCKCRPNLDPCGGTCVDLQSDGANCGACGTTCTVGTLCVSGKCKSAVMGASVGCPVGYHECDNDTSCVLVFDGNPINCGGCGVVCAVDQVCTIEGQCADYFVPPSACDGCGAGTTCCTMSGVKVCVVGSVCGPP